MRNIYTIIVACLALTAILSFRSLQTGKNTGAMISVVDSLEEDRAKYLKQVRESIKGKSKHAADSVFKNIKILGVSSGLST